MGRNIGSYTVEQKKYDKSCFNHGTCLWCQSDRRYKEFKEIERYKFNMKEWEMDDNL